MTRTWMLALITAVLTAGAPGRSEPVRPVEAPDPLQIRQVALFKNGLGFFTGEAAFPAGQTALQFILPAAPSHGTFWLSYPAGIELTSVVAAKARAEGELLEAITIPEILKANIGKKVRLIVDKKPITGRISDFTEDRREPIIMPYTPGVPEIEVQPREIWPPYEAGLVLIDVNDGTFCLDPRSIQHVTFLDGAIQQRFARTQETVAVRVQTAAPAQGRLTISFLAKGITWAPSYMVDITGEDMARFSAKALVINEAYDLQDVPVRLVTGFPHLQFKDIFSPIGHKQTLAQFLQALASGRPPQAPAAPVMMQRVAYAEAAVDLAPSYGPAEQGETAEDLFLYPAGRLTLAKDEVAYVPLFTEAVPYEHLYQWDIPNYMDEAGRLIFEGRPPQDRPKEQEVWHSLRLENTTKVPWTTAPAETVENGVILGQDTLDHTPPGDETTLRITRALSIEAEQQEFEVERQRDAVQMRNVRYDLVTVRGELSVTNFQDKPITLEITKTLSGEVQSTDPKAKVEKLAAGLKRMNPTVKLTWTIDIAPRESTDVIYTYQVYVRL